MDVSEVERRAGITISPPELNTCYDMKKEERKKEMKCDEKKRCSGESGGSSSENPA